MTANVSRLAQVIETWKVISSRISFSWPEKSCTWKVMENLSSSFRKFFFDYKGILVSFELS